MDQVEKRILEKVRDLFFKKGFSKVTMDELAAELGISKKTLYNHFSGKADMLEQVVRNLIEELNDGADRIMLKDLEFTDKLMAILSFTGNKLSKVQPEFLVDLEKSNPEIGEKLASYKKDVVLRRFSLLLDEGQQKGFVRKDLNKSMAMLLYTSVLEGAMNPEYIRLLPNDAQQQVPHHAADIFKEMLMVALNGILNK